jgi:AcrR family transcriptional regulator
VTVAAQDTKQQLMQAALETVRDEGLAAASARTIAARAGANQALVFYHFQTVSGLLEAASNHAVDESIGRYREAFAGVDSLTELLAIGRDLHRRETEFGNVTLMAQLMSGAQHDPVLARATRYAMNAWTHEIGIVLRRVLPAGPVGELVDPDGLAHVISAGFVGLELYDGVDPDGASRALDTLGALGELVDVVNRLGPVASRAVRSKVAGSSRRGRR